MNILLVEDSDEVSCITVEYLHELGHQVVAVTAAEKAIARLKHELFDAVMTDIRLPGMLHARMIRPAVAGSVPEAVDTASIADIPGARVVWRQGFLGVAAPREWDAIQAAGTLKVAWSEAKPPFPGNAALYDHIRAATPITRMQ